MNLEDLDHNVLSDIFNKVCEKSLNNGKISEKEEEAFYDFDQEYLNFSFLFVFMKKMSLSDCGENYENIEKLFTLLVTRLATLIKNTYFLMNSDSELDSFFTRRFELLENSYFKEVKDLKANDFFVFLSTQFEKSSFTQVDLKNSYERFRFAYVTIVLRLFFVDSLLREKDLRGTVDFINIQYKDSYKPLLNSVFFGSVLNKGKKEIKCLSDLPVYRTFLN